MIAPVSGVPNLKVRDQSQEIRIRDPFFAFFQRFHILINTYKVYIKLLHVFSTIVQ